MIIGLRRELKLPKLTVVSPDAGGVERRAPTRSGWRRRLAIVDKRREQPNVAEVHHVIGDVEGRTALIVDDMVDTGGTLGQGRAGAQGRGRARGAGLLLARRAVGQARSSASRRARSSKLIVTDSIPLGRGEAQLPKIVVLTIAELMAKAIQQHPRGGVGHEPVRLKQMEQA